MKRPFLHPVLLCISLQLLALSGTLEAQPEELPEPLPRSDAQDPLPAAADSSDPTDATTPDRMTGASESAQAELEEGDWHSPEQTQPAPRSVISELLCIGTEGYVARDQETPEMIVVFGKGTVEGRVRHDMVVVFGTARIDGEIGGDLVAPFSRIEVGPRARIRGDLVIVGGSLKADPGARFDGQRVDMSWERLDQLPGFPAVRSMVTGVGDWIGQGLMLGRLLPASWGWWWWVAIAMGLCYLFVSLLAPAAVGAGAAELETQPVACFFIGILGYLLANVLLVILGATGIGVLAWPFVLMALLVVQITGKASLYQSVGTRIGRQIGGGTLTTPLPALLAGFLIFTVVYMIPVLGLLAWLIVAPLGLGAALMAMFGTLRSAGDNQPPVSLPVGSPHAPLSPAWEIESPEVAPMSGPPPVIGSSSLQSRSGAELASLPRAGFWIRTAATLLDFLVVLLPLALMRIPEYFLIPWIAYHVAFWAYKGTTIGGVVCRLKVVRLDGQPLNFPVALVRSLSSFLSALVLFLGFFWVGWTRQRLAWHDRIAGTTIVRVPVGIALL
jgi:uncharacterized RDD family membrane protein YckC/cytoskeletal protein CcmA (bactofilin family)